jgi:hypothetical protein
MRAVSLVGGEMMLLLFMLVVAVELAEVEVVAGASRCESGCVAEESEEVDEEVDEEVNAVGGDSDAGSEGVEAGRGEDGEGALPKEEVSVLSGDAVRLRRLPLGRLVRIRCTDEEVVHVAVGEVAAGDEEEERAVDACVSSSDVDVRSRRIDRPSG